MTVCTTLQGKRLNISRGTHNNHWFGSLRSKNFQVEVDEVQQNKIVFPPVYTNERSKLTYRETLPHQPSRRENKGENKHRPRNAASETRTRHQHKKHRTRDAAQETPYRKRRTRNAKQETPPKKPRQKERNLRKCRSNKVQTPPNPKEIRTPVPAD